VQNGSLGSTGKYSVGAQKAVFLLYSVRNTSAGPLQPSRILECGASCKYVYAQQTVEFLNML
jgi:hypothetical protein